MKFCFWGNISGALIGKTLGGAELQIALLAKSLAMQGNEVAIIDPYIDESFTTKEGIRVINIPGWNKGLVGIRLFFNRIPALYKVLKDQNADFYYVRMRAYLHFVSYLACKKVKGKFIVATAHDLDLASFRERFKNSYATKLNLFKFLTLYLPNDWVFDYLLKKADYVIVQHEDQKSCVKNTKGSIAVFRNIFDSSNLPSKCSKSGDYYIHAGTLTVLKGSLNLYRLVKSMDKSIRIVVIGDYYDRRSKTIYKKLQEFENVEVKGRLGHKDTIQCMAQAKALINTSNYEGFPNIFLEAWATGIPVISLNVNPGNVFGKFQLGVCCNGDLDQMKEYIETGALDNLQQEPMKAYVSEFHGFDTAAERFLKIIQNT